MNKNKTRMNDEYSMKIRDNVFGFYAKNKKECDTFYETAEDVLINDIYEPVDEEEKNLLFSQVAIVVLTANKYECNILHQNLYSKNNEKIKQIQIRLSTPCDIFSDTYAYWFKWNGYVVLHLHANVTGSYTIGGSADLVRWITDNEYLYPTTIVSLGICFGVTEDKNRLGNVVISKKIYPYFVGAKIKNDKLSVVDDNAFRLNSYLYSEINKLINQNSFNIFNEKMGINTVLENYITGEAVVSSKKARDDFVNITTQNIFAGDMEGYGLFKECNDKRFLIPCFIVKSICDWGVEKNFDENDECVLNEFIINLQKNSSQKEDLLELTMEDYKQLLVTLKDRIQAFSAYCAFGILDIILEKRILRRSLLDLLRIWISSYKGVTTSCSQFMKKSISILNDFGIKYKVSKRYIHNCIVALHIENKIKCKDECLNSDILSSCQTIEYKDSTIDIVK